MNRRDFAKLAGVSALTLHSLPVISANSQSRKEPGKAGGVPLGPRVPLGVCNHSLRGTKPNADQLIDYAGRQLVQGAAAFQGAQDTGHRKAAACRRLLQRADVRDGRRGRSRGR